MIIFVGEHYSEQITYYCNRTREYRIIRWTRLIIGSDSDNCYFNIGLVLFVLVVAHKGYILIEEFFAQNYVLV